MKNKLHLAPKILVYIGIILLLSSCATLNKKSEVVEPEEVDYDYVKDGSYGWTMNAKVSYRGDSSSAIALLKLQHFTVGHYDIRIFVPQGQIARLEQRGEHNKLVINNKEIINVTYLSEVIDAEIGYYIPLQQLSSWVIGEPYSSSNSSDFNGGIIESVNQDGWEIFYSDFDRRLARRIAFIRPPYQINLFINSWYKE